jgi:hypothetical protein
MGALHLDKLTRSFLEVGRDPSNFNAFSDLQDPTYLSFRLDFFPDDGLSFPDDSYSSGGLLRPSGESGLIGYGFYDSATDYLARIGSPNRQLYLEAFVKMLRSLQNDAPWYFQTITGLGDLYKIDPAIPFRGKDKVLTIDCLESIDLRVTLLADLYRNLAFDMQNMREVLPINLRTFNMAVHVLEFRRFNTTFGVLADQISKKRGIERPTTGQASQQNTIDSNRRNVFNQNNSSLFTGTFDNINSLATGLNTQLGGLFTNLGQQAGQSYNTEVESAFEAISVQTFFLKDCEFDFYSEAPGYLETVSVKEIPEATHRFKIKVGKIQKTGYYPFYNYVISEFAKYSNISSSDVAAQYGTNRNSPSPKPHYFEERDPGAADTETFFNTREAIFPSADQAPKKASSNAYSRSAGEADNLRRKPLERLLGGLLDNATNFVNTGLNQALGNLTGGLLGTAPLGNVYGDPSFIRRAVDALNNFFTPGNQINTGQTSATPPQEILGNIKFQALNLESTISPPNVGFSAPSTESFNQNNIYSGTPPLPTDQPSNSNVFNGTPPLPTDQPQKENVYSGTPPLPTDQPQKENVYSGTPPLPTGGAPDENVFNGETPPPTGEIGNNNVFE